jgi:5-(carboxyamino)imidazole ribonucleotide mutase
MTETAWAGAGEGRAPSSDGGGGEGRSAMQVDASLSQRPWVGVIMGGKSDHEHLAVTSELLTELGIPHEVRVVSAHRTPDRMFEYATTAAERGIEVIIAAAGGAAHLPGMVAAKTVLPVIGVPIPATALNGLDALLSIVQMPKGVPVATMAIGKPGAANAALFAAAILSGRHPELRERLAAFRAAQEAAVLRDAIL